MTLQTLKHDENGRPRIVNAINLPEAMCNHIDLSDVFLDILSARDEHRNDPHSLGVRVMNIISDFESRVTDECESRDDKLASVYMQDSIDKFNALGDFKLKKEREWK